MRQSRRLADAAQERRTAEGILFTDQYQLTMAQLYYRVGLHERPAQFEHYFRSYPDYGQHQAGYCVNAGLETLLSWMAQARFTDQDVAYLRGQRGASGAPVFADDFLAWLQAGDPFGALNLRAIPEGRVVHPNVPLTVVEGPLAAAQILESALLNHLNFQTLIATKASRIYHAGGRRPVLEFGLRRAQGWGANEGTRAAMIGGADFTSNVGQSHVLGYPPKGTHAHSMVQVFVALGGSELDAFRAYADVYPDECLLLVDTISTLGSGVPNAIRVFEELRRAGHEPVGIRLDSGDLAHLSVQAAKMLDDAGFPNTRIVLSNQIDELVIWQILTQIADEAPRSGVDPQRLADRLTYGVGTRLVTSAGDAALDGIYKLVAVREDVAWAPAIKISETPAKTPNPGHKGVWRLYDTRNKAVADVLSVHDEDVLGAESLSLHHPTDHTKQRIVAREELADIEPLHVEVLRAGRLVYDLPTIEEMRAVREADIERLDLGVQRIINPHVYHVSLTERLWNLKQELISSVGGSVGSLE
ncbi:MAG: nicotinate phosphoribosyltransferase [Anaerolineae bacterium]